MSELERYFTKFYGRELSDSEKAAAKKVKRHSVPLGLSEWQVTDGAIYYSSKSALAAQIGINRSEAER